MTDAVRHRLFAFAAFASLTFAASAASAACDGAGIITRIDGRPQDIVITRTAPGEKAGQVSRPRVLEVICHGDQVKVTGTTKITLSVDGAGRVVVDAAKPYVVPTRKGAPTLAGNAYRQVNEQVMPDMKRLPWNVRLKGSGSGFGFALPTLASGKQTVQAGTRDLLVRLTGGSRPFKVDLVSDAGATVGSVQSDNVDVVLPKANLQPGAYTLKASDQAGNVAEAKFTVVREAAPANAAFQAFEDPEIRAAASAADLAKNHPDVWAFEAEQMLAAAPANGLDREQIYQFVESYELN